MERITAQRLISQEKEKTGNARGGDNYKSKDSWMNYVLYFILSTFSLSSFAQNKWQVDEIFRLETKVAETNDEILIIKDKIQNCDLTISKSEKIIGLAKQSSNSIAEGIAQNALQKSQDAREKNVTRLIAISEYLKKLNAMLAYLKTNPKDAELSLEKFNFENKNDEWMKAKDEAVLKRLEANNPLCDNLLKSLKTNAPPPLMIKTFANLQIGDVLLITRGSQSETDLLNASGKLMSWAINGADQLASGSMGSKASHTVIYVKEINGKKMFMDNVPGKGTTLISEEEYLFLYGNREANVAQLAQPLKPDQYQKLYDVARKLADDQLQMKGEQVKNGSLIRGSKYGIMGSDMVCSEASRWVLTQVGANIPTTEDPTKLQFGIKYSPADFNKSNSFIITPLQDVPKVKNYSN